MMPTWLVIFGIVVALAGFLCFAIPLIILTGKIEETHETVLWIKDKLDQ